MYRGINAITIDSKGRVAVPTRYRDMLAHSNEALFPEEAGKKSHAKATLIVTIDTNDTCLLLYNTEEWQLIETKLQNMPSFNPAVRRIQRLLIGHATDVELDSNGRVLLPPLLREYAKLKKQVVMIGQGNKFEIWDEKLWHDKCQQWLAEEIADKDILPGEMQSFSL